MVTHSSILAWKIPWTKEPGGLQSIDLGRVRHDSVTNTFPFLFFSLCVAVVQSLSYVLLFVTAWTAACQTSLSFTISWSWLKLMSTELVMPSNLLICCPPLPLPSICPSIKVFSSEPALHIRWPEYWNFSSSNSPFNGYSGLVSFRIDWFDLLAVQGTLKSLLQHHIWQESILWCSAFFMPTLTSVHDYWKDHSFDYTDVCQQNDVSAF